MMLYPGHTAGGALPSVTCPRGVVVRGSQAPGPHCLFHLLLMHDPGHIIQSVCASIFSTVKWGENGTTQNLNESVHVS